MTFFKENQVICSALITSLLSQALTLSETSSQGGHTNIFLTGMLVREQISTTQKSRMTLNSNPQKIECPKIQTQKNRVTQDAIFVKV